MDNNKDFEVSCIYSNSSFHLTESNPELTLKWAALLLHVVLHTPTTLRGVKNVTMGDHVVTFSVLKVSSSVAVARRRGTKLDALS